MLSVLSLVWSASDQVGDALGAGQTAYAQGKPLADVVREVARATDNTIDDKVAEELVDAVETSVGLVRDAARALQTTAKLIEENAPFVLAELRSAVDSLEARSDEIADQARQVANTSEGIATWLEGLLRGAE